MQLAVCRDAAMLLGTAEETASVREAARHLRLVDAIRNITWDTWECGMPVTIQIAFDQTCAWQGVFFGDELQ